jgi:dGTPase
LWKNAYEKMRHRWPGRDFADLKHPTISAMITALAEDLIHRTLSEIDRRGIRTPADVRNAGTPLVAFSPEIAARNAELKKFLHANMYSHHRVIRMEEKAKRIINDLFHAYMNRPEQLPKEYLARTKKDSVPRTVCDYIAGMTDRFAMDEHMKLFDPHTRV